MTFHTKLGLIVLGGVVVMVAVPAIISSQQKPLNLSSYNSYSFDFTNLKVESESKGLKEVVMNDLSPLPEDNPDYPGTFGIYVASLSHDEKFGYNDDLAFPSASLYKLVVIAAVYQEIEEGNMSPDDTVSDSKDNLDSMLGGGEYGYENYTGDISFSVDEALSRIASFSDNYSALLLVERVRSLATGQAGDLVNQTNQDKTSRDPVQNEAYRLGMNNTDFSNPIVTTTPADIAHYFQLLYQGEVVSVKSSQAIVDLLTKAQSKDRIPAKLPEGLQIAHKTGELDRVRHDAGIVFLEGNPYVLVLMSQDLQYEDDGIQRLAQISGDVYNYFQKEQN